MYKDKKVCAIVPARGGSKGVLRKNLRTVNGKPLIYWSILSAKKSQYIDSFFVSTEDTEIAKIASMYKANVPYLRPQELARDSTPGILPILEMIKTLDLSSKFDILVLLQPTSPMRSEVDIDKAISSFIDSMNEYDSLVSVVELEHPIFWNRRIINDKLVKYSDYNHLNNYQRQNFEKVYRLNGALYVSSIDKIVQFETFEMENVKPFIMSSHHSIDIDNELDLFFVDCMMKENL